MVTQVVVVVVVVVQKYKTWWWCSGSGDNVVLLVMVMMMLVVMVVLMIIWCSGGAVEPKNANAHQPSPVSAASPMVANTMEGVPFISFTTGPTLCHRLSIFIIYF